MWRAVLGPVVLVVVLAGVPAAPAAESGPAAGARAVWPVDGAVVRGFEPPEHPYGPGHRGADLAAEPGTAVRAALPGVVAFSGVVAGRGWVTVNHGGGLDTTYGVLDPRAVSAGQRVAAGDVLGQLAAGAAHLDWGARLGGHYIDPLRLFGRWRAHLVRVPG